MLSTFPGVPLLGEERDFCPEAEGQPNSSDPSLHWIWPLLGVIDLLAATADIGLPRSWSLALPYNPCYLTAVSELEDSALGGQEKTQDQTSRNSHPHSKKNP